MSMPETCGQQLGCDAATPKIGQHARARVEAGGVGNIHVGGHESDEGFILPGLECKGTQPEFLRVLADIDSVAERRIELTIAAGQVRLNIPFRARIYLEVQAIQIHSSIASPKP